MKTFSFKQPQLTRLQTEQLIELLSCWTDDAGEIFAQTRKWGLPPQRSLLLMAARGGLSRSLSGYAMLLTNVECETICKILTFAAQPIEIECLRQVTPLRLPYATATFLTLYLTW